MIKLLFMLPLFAGASWAGTTYYSGTQTQPAYNRLLEQLNNLDFLAVESVEYNTGFLNSTAITKLSTKADKKAAKNKGSDDEAEADKAMYLYHEISHSPISMIPANARFGAAKIVTTLMVDKIEDQKTREKLKAFENGTPFVLQTNVEIDGETKNELTLNPLNFSDASATINSTGGKINMLTTPDGLYKGDLKLGESTTVITDGEPLKLRIGETDAAYHFEQIDELLFNIDAGFDIDSIVASDDGGSGLGEITITGVSANYDVTLTGDAPTVTAESAIGDISHPIVPLKSMNQTFAIEGFSADALTEYSTDIRAWAAADANGESYPAPSEEQIADIMKRTFKPGTSMRNHTHATTTDGDMDIKLDFTFLGNGSPSGSDGMETIGDLARTIAGNLAIKADTDAVMNSFIGPMLMDSPAVNYFVIGDEFITLDANLNNLKLKVNDETIPLDLLIGHMLDAPLTTIF